MRFHYGLGVGHLYSHNVRVVETPSYITQTAAQTADEHLESRGSLGETAQWEDITDEEDIDDAEVGAEGPDFFNHGLNASTESLIDALDEMFAAGHILDYEN